MQLKKNSNGFTLVAESDLEKDFIQKLFKNIEEENNKLKEENKELKEKIKKMEKTEKDFIYIMRKYVLSKIDIVKLEFIYSMCKKGEKE